MSDVDPVLHRLWPGSTLVVGAGPLPAGARVVAEYTAVPGTREPRFLLPRSRSAADVVQRSFRARRAGRAALTAAGQRLVLGASRGWPVTGQRLRVLAPSSPGAQPLEAAVAELLGHPVRLGVQLGPRRANRKPMLHVLGPGDVPVASVKVGVDPLTERLVRAEGDALTGLATRSTPGVVVPRVLHRGRLLGCEMLVTAALPLGSARAAVPQQAVLAAMATVGGIGRQPGRPAAELGFVRECRADAATLDPTVGAVPLQVLDQVASGPVRLESGTWHGDWTVWNMAYWRREVLLWDWERSAGGVPVGLDLLHLTLQTRLGRQRPVPALSRDLVEGAPQLLHPLGVAPEQARATALLYLCHLVVRYCRDDQAGHGLAVGRVGDWVVPALQEALDTGASRRRICP